VRCVIGFIGLVIGNGLLLLEPNFNCFVFDQTKTAKAKINVLIAEITS